jgi:hypothetical protein
MAHYKERRFPRWTMTIDPKQIQAVFVAAIEEPTPAARAAYLDQACGADIELRQRV